MKSKVENGKRPRGRKPQLEPVPFREVLPLVLKNKVSGRGGHKSEAICIQEMSVMFSCLKTHEFSESKCSKEIEGFKKCANEYKANNLKMLEAEKKLGATNTSVGSSILNPRQLNILLKRFPHPK